jgi:hypothetical protein
MALLTLACAHANHATCANKFCQCDCHKDREALREKARRERAEARQLAHAAVKNFDHNPDLVNTQAAILALGQYEKTLKDARHGR